MSNSTLATIDTAIAAFKAAKFVIIVDDEDRENEGDLVIAADYCDTEAVNFMVTEGRGLVCLSMEASLIDRLNIPMMVPDTQNSSGFGTGFTISVEAAAGVSTGISASDRAQTIKTLIDPKSTPNDIAMPGHIFPLRAKAGGVLERRGQTEASVDLAKLSGLTPAGVICEVMAADGSMMRLTELLEFAAQFDIPVVSVEALAQYRQAQESAADAVFVENSTSVLRNLVTVIGTSRLPTPHGEFDITVFRDEQGLEHSALVHGDLNANAAPLTRIHSECLTGDAFGSLRCDCGDQLQKSLSGISKANAGVLVYLRQEGRGIGLGNKIRAYSLQDDGLDTVDANQHLGFPADARTYDVAAAILQHLEVTTVSLLTNNPDKHVSLERLGISIASTEPLHISPHTENENYLHTKAVRMGHAMPDSIVSNNNLTKDKKNGKLD